MTLFFVITFLTIDALLYYQIHFADCFGFYILIKVTLTMLTYLWSTHMHFIWFWLHLQCVALMPLLSARLALTFFALTFWLCLSTFISA